MILLRQIFFDDKFFDVDIWPNDSISVYCGDESNSYISFSSNGEHDTHILSYDTHNKKINQFIQFVKSEISEFGCMLNYINHLRRGVR